MKREEKNLLSRQKIMDSAMLEFSGKGYGMSSINTICAAGNISKGILYHYFKDKDEIYLTCVRECFGALTTFLRESAGQWREGSAAEGLRRYFEVRQRFFRERPMYQRLFRDAVVTPPPHLGDAIKEIKKDFDAFNLEALKDLLNRIDLRPDVTREEVIEVFQQYQDFINAKYQAAPGTAADAEAQERGRSRALSILLYGVAARQKKER